MLTTSMVGGRMSSSDVARRLVGGADAVSVPPTPAVLLGMVLPTAADGGDSDDVVLERSRRIGGLLRLVSFGFASVRVGWGRNSSISEKNFLVSSRGGSASGREDMSEDRAPLLRPRSLRQWWITSGVASGLFSHRPTKAMCNASASSAPSTSTRSLSTAIVSESCLERVIGPKVCLRSISSSMIRSMKSSSATTALSRFLLGATRRDTYSNTTLSRHSATVRLKYTSRRTERRSPNTSRNVAHSVGIMVSLPSFHDFVNSLWKRG
mmetsp:Transcript_2095/g.5747  ORF Transcript_2095/g.5747 Transcript_2095/m.5747 type:complete len:266 (-) Transcript_2095:71-868(-)